MDKKSSYPTVFIHGWNGSERSFKTMLDRLSRRYDGPKKKR
ncbi:alpha/beta hydrolase [Terrilactibacillus sp. S3-3]|nr:alpha/beta hydrolase [Terrilactibacillus sp. S3-3]